MFLFHIAYAFGLIVVAVGVIMIAWALRNEGKGVGLVKTFGYIITIVAVFALLCTGYFGILYWSKGYFSNPMGMRCAMMESMQNKPMQMMQGQGTGTGNGMMMQQGQMPKQNQ